MRTKQPTRRYEIAAETNANVNSEFEPLPASMETTGPKLVYLYLRVVGKTTIEDLAETLGMKLLTLYPMLKTLESDDLVVRDGETFMAEGTTVRDTAADDETPSPNGSENEVSG